MVQSAIVVALVYWFINVLDQSFLSWQCLSRPIVVAPLVGLLLGDFHTGIVMGASLEAIFMGISAIGGSVPADSLSATCISVAYSILTGADAETGIALALPIGTLMSSWNAMLTPIFASLAPYWENLCQKNIKAFTVQTLLFTTFVQPLVNTVVLFIAVASGIEGLNAALAVLPAWVMTGLGAASSMMTAVGFAILVSMIWSNEVGIFFFVGYVLSSVTGLDSLKVAIIAAAIAITMFFGEKRHIDTKNAMANSSAATAVNDEEDFF